MLFFSANTSSCRLFVSANTSLCLFFLRPSDILALLTCKRVPKSIKVQISSVLFASYASCNVLSKMSKLRLLQQAITNMVGKYCFLQFKFFHAADCTGEWINEEGWVFWVYRAYIHWSLDDERLFRSILTKGAGRSQFQSSRPESRTPRGRIPGLWTLGSCFSMQTTKAHSGKCTVGFAVAIGILLDGSASLAIFCHCSRGVPVLARAATHRLHPTLLSREKGRGPLAQDLLQHLEVFEVELFIPLCRHTQFEICLPSWCAVKIRTRRKDVTALLLIARSSISNQ